MLSPATFLAVCRWYERACLGLAVTQQVALIVEACLLEAGHAQLSTQYAESFVGLFNGRVVSRRTHKPEKIKATVFLW